MSLLERVVRAHRCRSTHHFIAFDALSLIAGEEGEAWKSLFLVHHEHLLEGAKAPDSKFKDFKNHVCHVNEGQWGGARDAAMEWYAKSVELLRAKQWSRAAYALGVLSHYYADPIQPFHTAQTEEEGVIHRAMEWSIAKSRDVIDELIETNGYPDVEVPEGPGFVADMVLEGATLSNVYYDTFIDHYNFERGVAHPPAGLDDTLREAIAELVAYATAGFAALVSKAIDEAAVSPPKVNLTLQGYIETLDIPLRWITSKMADASDRAQVERMYREFQKTGKVVRSLPDDDKFIRKLHAKQVLRVPLKELDAQEIAPIGTKHVRPEGEAPEIDDEVIEDEVPVIKPMRKEAAAVAPAPEAEDEEIFEEADEADLEEEDISDDTDEEDEALLSADDGDEDDEEDSDEEYDDDEESDEEYEDDEYEDEDDDEEEFDEESDDEEYDEDEDDESEEYDEDEDYDSSEYEDDDEAEEYDDAAEADEADLDEESVVDAEEDEGVYAHTPRLTRDDPVVDAPSIGRKTAKRLARAGITTIGDLLDCDIDETAFQLDVHYIDSETLRDWQDQTKLMMDVPGLRVHDVQILVGAGIRTAKELADAPARTLFLLATEFLNSPEGEYVQRGDDVFVEDEVEEWIERAKGAA
ncbi:MAG TPA: DUF4332 domain-containing protein [Hyphomonas sp.]|nr:DUF4332 domain-containing protein [Hyphomonas sp.]